MPLGPFLSYAPPGVYTRSQLAAAATNVGAGLRIPALIGVGQEELELDDFEIVRGSSATVDQQIVNEDPSAAWVVDSRNPNSLVLGKQDGTLYTLRVRNFPIVDGQGFGRVTNDIRALSVTVNGEPVALGSVQGAKGLVTLQIPPQPGDTVRVTYFFHRGDTSFLDDVSDQVTVFNAILVSPKFDSFSVDPGVDDEFIVTVNNETYTIILPFGVVPPADVVAAITAANVPNLSASVSTDNLDRQHIMLTAPSQIVIGNGSANAVLGFLPGTKSTRNQAFRVFQRPIVDGSSGGITTTDTSKLVVKVNGKQVVATSVDGTNGIVTLPIAPPPNSEVTIQYWANTWQDTFDYLPISMVTSVLRCGIAAGRSDYIQGTDFVISNPTNDVSVINWGASYQVVASATTTGATPFDGSSGSGGQIVGTLVDDQLFLGLCTRVVNSATIPATVSATDFLLPEVPTTGNGRNTTLGLSKFNAVTNTRQDLVTNRPDLVKVYTGRTLRDALSRPPVPVVAVDGVSRRVTLQASQPNDYIAFATFYYSRLADDDFTITNVTEGAEGVGKYSIHSRTRDGALYQVAFGTKQRLSQAVQWPRGNEQIPDAFHTGDGIPVAETVTVTFSQSAATNAVYTNRGASPYSFYAASSAWNMKVNGTVVATDLKASAPAVMVGGRVPLDASGNVKIPAAPGNVFNFAVDGQAVSVELTTGTPDAIVGAINGAVGLTIGGTASQVASCMQIDGNGDAFFILRSPTTPRAVPAGFDDVSSILIQKGTAETSLGFKAFASSSGSPDALNKPASIIGTVAGPFPISPGVNDQLNIRIDGQDLAITLVPTDPTMSPEEVAAAINGVAAPLLGKAIATVGNVLNAHNRIRLTSATNTVDSAVVILQGSANVTLGFSAQQFATQETVGAQDVINCLMATPSFSQNGVAYVHSQTTQIQGLGNSGYGLSNLGGVLVSDGHDRITFESLVTGEVESTIEFLESSAYRPGTGVDIVAGVDGDHGEGSEDNFVVTSDNEHGSSGVGYPGQTYTDGATGLRFTVLPATNGHYSNKGSFTLQVTDTFDVLAQIPTYSIGGMELLVSNTVGVGVGDTATLTTYNPTGMEPAVGDFYSISYRYRKQDYSPRVFQQLKTIEANFGRTSAENRLTMAAYLAILNGAVLVILKQVTKVPGTNQASDQAFNDAIDELATPLPGNIKPDILVPLTSSAGVFTHLTAHCEIQSNIRNQQERMGFIGFASGTSPTTAQAVARGLNSNRIVAFYPDSAVVTLTDELGQVSDHLVDGSFFAAALAGAVVSPAVDVATPYTRRRIQGFSRIPRRLDAVEANQTAVAGVTILEDLDPIVRVRQGFTTNMSSVLTRLPTVTQITDYVQQQSRAALDSFIGTKFLASRTNDVVVSMTALFRALQQAEIIGGYTGINAAVDEDDPTVLRVEAIFQPIFPLLYIVVTFTVRARA